jgi:hypothetical protein
MSRHSPLNILGVISLAVAVALLMSGSAAALENENLLVPLPKGFKVGYQNKNDNQLITEMVPTAETVEAWTEMVTVQVFYRMKDVTPAAYRARIEKLWVDACPGATFAKVKEGTENLYPMASWSLTCPLNKATGKPEYTWMKGVQGRDSFYLVQKAFRSEPTPQQVKSVDALLAAAKVCDTRIPGQKCKPVKEDVGSASK